MSSPDSTPALRFHEMDSLRATAMLLGLVYHALFSFQLHAWGYYAQDVSSGRAADVAMWFVHGFRMELFFTIGGFFGHLVYARHGLRGFVKNRSRRIVLPLLVAGALLVPIDHALRAYALQAGTIGTDYPDVYGWPARPFYLWFLFYMAMLDVCTVVGLVTFAWRLPARFISAVDRLFAAVVKSPFKVPLLAAPLLGIGLMHPRFQFFDYVPVPLWLAYYGLFFFFGWLLYRQTDLLKALVPQTWPHLVAALALGSFVAWLEAQGGEGVAWHEPVLLGAKALYGWCMVFGLTGLAVRHLAFPHPTVRYLADASYWLYLVHWPVVLFIQISVAQLPLFGPVKALGVFAATLTVALVSYRYLVRYTFIGAILNGPRQRPGAAVQGASASAAVPP